MWQYPFDVREIVDADTIDADIDLGFHMSLRGERIRFLDVDTHEIHGVSEDSEEYERGMEEKEFVKDWFMEHDDGSEFPYVLESHSNQGSFYRWLGVIKARRDGDSLNELLLDTFDGVEYGED